MLVKYQVEMAISMIWLGGTADTQVMLQTRDFALFEIIELASPWLTYYASNIGIGVKSSR